MDYNHDDNQTSFIDQIDIKTNASFLETLATLESLSEDVFVVDNDSIIFNSSAFPKITGADLKVLKESIPEYVCLMIMLFSMHRGLLAQFNEDRYKKMICRDIETICEWIDEDSNNLDILNKWLNVFSKYVDKEKGDQCGEYQKRKRNQGTN